VNLCGDHVAGATFILSGALILSVSGDLPFGTLASPGAGMMPKLLIGLMLVFGRVLLARAGRSPPLAAIAWDDFRHAVRLLAITAACVALYTWLGFVVSMIAPTFELSLRQSLVMSSGDWLIFFRRPIAATLLVLCGGLLFLSVAALLRKDQRGRLAPANPEEA
jgi:hypothetical protein